MTVKEYGATSVTLVDVIATAKDNGEYILAVAPTRMQQQGRLLRDRTLIVTDYVVLTRTN